MSSLLSTDLQLHSYAGLGSSPPGGSSAPFSPKKKRERERESDGVWARLGILSTLLQEVPFEFSLNLEAKSRM